MRERALDDEGGGECVSARGASGLVAMSSYEVSCDIMSLAIRGARTRVVLLVYARWHGVWCRQVVVDARKLLAVHDGTRVAGELIWTW